MADSTQNGPVHGGAGGGAVVSSTGPGGVGPAVWGGWGHGAGPALLSDSAAPLLPAGWLRSRCREMPLRQGRGGVLRRGWECGR